MLNKDQVDLINSMIKAVTDEMKRMHGEEIDYATKAQLSATQSVLHGVRAMLTIKSEKPIVGMAALTAKYTTEEVAKMKKKFGDDSKE